MEATMDAENVISPRTLDGIEAAGDALVEKLGSGRKRKYARFLIAALSGIPWIGGVITASTSLSAEFEQGQVNELHRLWLAEHRQKARDLIGALGDIFTRLEILATRLTSVLSHPNISIS
jgi:hypothetical protein